VGIPGALSVVCVALACAGPAAAQLPPVFPPEDPPPPQALPPSTTVLAPSRSSTAFDGNPSKSGEIDDSTVFGPLRKSWTRLFPERVAEPLVVDGRIVVSYGRSGESYGAAVAALRPSDGKVIWRREIDSVYFDAAIAAAEGVVVAVDPDGMLTAFALNDGSRLWTVPIDVVINEAEPVIDAGTVYVFEGGAVRAFDLATGASRWTAPVPLQPGSGPIAIDNARAFVADDCGSVIAFSRADGRLVWQASGISARTCFDADVIVAGGRVFGAEGVTYDAVTGAALGSLPAQARAVVGGLAYTTNGSLRAYDVVTGELAWDSRRRVDLAPKVVGPTVYATLQGDFDSTPLYGISTANGRLLSRVQRPIVDNGQGDSHDPGLTVGAGHVVVATHTGISALAPALQPEPRGVDLLAPKSRAYFVGARFNWIAGIGSAMRGSTPIVELQRDEQPFGGWKTIDRRRTLADGGVVLKGPLRRNSIFRARTKGAGPSKPIKLYAYARIGFDVKRTSRRTGVFNVRIRGVPARTLRRTKAFAYLGSAAEQRFERLGAGGIDAKGRSGKARIPFRLLNHVGAKDIVAVCVRGLPKAGYGRNFGLLKGCGAKNVAYPKRSKRVATRRADGEARSAGPAPPAIGAAAAAR